MIGQRQLQKLFRKNEQLLEAGDYDKAREGFSRIIEIAPSYAAAYFCRGEAFSGIQQWDDAIADFDEVIRRCPSLMVAYYHRGNALYYRGMMDEAITDFTVVIQQNDIALAADAYFERGHCYWVSNDPANDLPKAMQDFTMAVWLDPGSAVNRYARAGCYARVGLWHFALPDYEEAIRLDTTNADAYTGCAKCYLGIGEWRLAVNRLSKFIRAGWGSAEERIDAYSDRAYAFDKLGKNNYALKDMMRVEDLKEELASRSKYAASNN